MRGRTLSKKRRPYRPLGSDAARRTRAGLGRRCAALNRRYRAVLPTRTGSSAASSKRREVVLAFPSASGRHSRRRGGSGASPSDGPDLRWTRPHARDGRGDRDPMRRTERAETTVRIGRRDKPARRRPDRRQSELPNVTGRRPIDMTDDGPDNSTASSSGDDAFGGGDLGMQFGGVDF